MWWLPRVSCALPHRSSASFSRRARSNVSGKPVGVEAEAPAGPSPAELEAERAAQEAAKEAARLKALNAPREMRMPCTECNAVLAFTFKVPSEGAACCSSTDCSLSHG